MTERPHSDDDPRFADSLTNQAQRDALLNQARLLRILVDHLPDYIYVKDLESRHVLNNKANVELLGAPSEAETIGKTVHDLFPKELADKYRMDDERVFQRGQPLLNREEQIVTRSGQVILLSTSKIPLRDETGTIIGLVGISRDITESKRAEAAIQKLATFPRNHPNPVMEFNASGELTYFNEAAEQMARKLDKTHPREILPSNLESWIKTSLASGQSSLHQEEWPGKGVFSWSLHPVISNQVVHCYVMDVSERHRLQAQLLQAHKMESIGKLAGGIAHDFNNILTVIQGHTSILLKADSLSAEVSESLREISNSAQKAADLTKQLLLFSRRGLLRPRPVQVNAVIAGIGRMIERLVGEHITLEMRECADLPIVHADPGMIEQIVLNLAVNARDAMPQGGNLLIQTGLKVVTSESGDPANLKTKPGNYVSLLVRDTGMGINPESLPHIFEPFFTTKDPGKGIGLGLSTVYGIVTQHGGTLEVRSELGKGSEFEVLLPVASIQNPAPDTPPAPAKRPAQGGNETILIVEDEPALRALTRHILQREGYRVILAESGLAALRLWNEQRPEVDLLMTDLVMPEGVNGRELANRLQSDRPGLKVLFTSGYSADVLGHDFVLEEGVNFLPKPYRPAELSRTIRQALDG